MNKRIAQGAEAIISLTESDTILKERIPKSYRNKELDQDLRKSRTRREAKIIQKLKGLAPKLLKTDDQSEIEMEFIDGDVLKNILDEHVELAKEIGKQTGMIHDKNIIHGDLTTSNIILDKNKKIRFIDFGLSFVSTKEEDRAVDVHLFKEAVESKHFRHEDEIWKEFLKGYNPKNREAILKRLEKVEQRGRNKGLNPKKNKNVY